MVGSIPEFSFLICWIFRRKLTWNHQAKCAESIKNFPLSMAARKLLFLNGQYKLSISRKLSGQMDPNFVRKINSRPPLNIDSFILFYFDIMATMNNSCFWKKKLSSLQNKMKLIREYLFSMSEFGETGKRLWRKTVFLQSSVCLVDLKVRQVAV